MKTLDVLEKLIAFDTDVQNSSLDAVHFVANYLSDHKANVSLISKNYGGQQDANRESLIASFGDIEKPGIIFSGHLDTTKIVEQEHLWERDPLKMTVVDGCVFGKGSTDMKGAISVLLSQVEKLKILAKKYPIHIVLTHDEEGVFTAINQLRDNNFYNLFPLKQKGCIVMEPSELHPVSAHRGNKRISVDIYGKAAHGSVPHMAVDAVYYTFQLYKKAKELAKTYFTEQDNRFEYPKTSLNISNFHAGMSDSMIPDKSHFDLSCRYVPNENIEKFFERFYSTIRIIEDEMKEKFPECSVIITERNHVLPLNTKPNSEILKLVQYSANNNNAKSVTYGSEAGYFQSMGIDTVICGPGNIMCAHKPNEFVLMSDLIKYERFLSNMISFNNSHKKEFSRND
ncbi:MAG: M20/M25/M40 family metallo-hydrolase [Alphaproteobacteria bacterium]|nr:M20/M25/M40 family metallo-hydrolase [Alphaproteobacteria bacterium]